MWTRPIPTRVPLMALMIAAACAAEPVYKRLPSGDYRLLDCVLQKGKAGTARIQIALTGNTITRVSCSASRCWIDQHALRYAGGRITGELSLASRSNWNRPVYASFFQVALSVADGGVTGKLTRLEGKGSRPPIPGGAVKGKVLTEAQLARTNAAPGGLGWPCWLGPSQNFSATPTKSAMVDDLSRARMVWVSDYIGPTELGSMRHGLCVGNWPAAGGASPVVADGKVFIYHFRPSGKDYHKDHVDRCLKHPEFGPRYRRNMRDIGWGMQRVINNWRIRADDIVTCIDAATGRTLWRTRWPEQGINLMEHKGGMTNHTPCAVDGRLHVMTVAGLLITLDARTGRELWRAEIPGFRAVIKGGKFRAGRNFARGVNWAGPAAVVPDNMGPADAGLVGFDRVTGKRLWHVKGRLIGNCQTPVRWRHQDRDYLIAAGASGTLVCIDPTSGRVLWKKQNLGHNQYQSVLDGDLLLVNLMTREQMRKQMETMIASLKHLAYGGRQSAYGQLGCLKLSPGGAELIWKLPPDYGFPYSKHAAVIHRGRAYVRGGLVTTGFYVVALATGKVLFEDPKDKNCTEAHAFAMNGRLFAEPDSQHGSTRWRYFDISGKQPEVLTPSFSPPHHQVTSYQTPQSHALVDGRIFIRGKDGVYCYDLRRRRPAAK